MRKTPSTPHPLKIAAAAKADSAPSICDALNDSAQQAPHPVVRRLWLRWLDALERAEQRITENFRVPPGGG